MVTRVQGCTVNKKGKETLSYSQRLGVVQDPREVSHPSQIAEKKQEYDLLTTHRELFLQWLKGYARMRQDRGINQGKMVLVGGKERRT